MSLIKYIIVHLLTSNLISSYAFKASVVHYISLVLYALVPEYLIKGELATLVGLYVTGIVSKA